MPPKTAKWATAYLHSDIERVISHPHLLDDDSAL